MKHQRVLSGLLFALAVQVAWASPWPEIPESERTLQEVAGFEGAPGVILLREGRVHLDTNSRSSYIEVYTRKKIFREEGVENGSFLLRTPEFSRTKAIEARAHLPDGGVVDLPKDATIEKMYSDYYGADVLSCSLPGVVKGTIIEYRYRSYFDSVFYPQVWIFQSRLPTVLSRVTYEIPKNIAFKPFVSGARPGIEIKEQVSENVEGVRVSYSASGLDPVPDEVARPPFVDLATRLTFLPIMRHRSGPNEPLFSSWGNAVDLVWGNTRRGYQKFFSGESASRRMGKKIGAQANTRQEKAQAIFRWVRDEIATIPYQPGWLNSSETYGICSHGGVWVGEREADQVLRRREADIAEKSLLLKSMLEGAKLEPRLAWVNPRDRGGVDRETPNPNQFSRVLVSVNLGGVEVFLDPSDRGLAFGQLHPRLQGVPCLVVTKRDHQWSDTPETPAEESVHEVHLELTIDENGRISGLGTLRLTGNYAITHLSRGETKDQARNTWTALIEEAFSGSAVTKVEAREQADKPLVTVEWEIDRENDGVPGDDPEISISALMNIKKALFTLAPSQRQTPVQLDFPVVEKLDLLLTWSAGWKLSRTPKPVSIDNSAGHLVADCQVAPANRRLRIRRDFMIENDLLADAAALEHLGQLLSAAATIDSENLFLTRWAGEDDSTG